MENGDLLYYLQNVRPDADKVQLLYDVACGMNYLESRGIVHADLKPGNVLVGKDGRAVIADFGLSKFEATSVSGSRPGTTVYMDPERLRLFMRDTSQRTRKPVSTMAGDIYSFGILCYVLLLMVSLQVWTKDGQPFGRIESVRDLMTDIVYEGKRPDISDARLQDMPPALKGLMQRCWEGKSSARPRTFKEVLEVLETLVPSSASMVDNRLESLEHPPRLTNLGPASTAGTLVGAAAAREGPGTGGNMPVQESQVSHSIVELLYPGGTWPPNVVTGDEIIRGESVDEMCEKITKRGVHTIKLRVGNFYVDEDLLEEI
ncbi:hypothetical protein HDU93_004033, partial [Gonapodya sp. JEL0774]